MNLTDIYRIFHPTVAQYTFFSAAHGIFFNIGNILGHKASLNKYEKIEITPWILSDRDGIKLEINKRSCRKDSDNWRLNNMLLMM
jgi:hypothetical protein